ncbi:S-phase kinase-associated protein 1A [Paramicrosporidium saccamoebae]|uniref:E3 ubiquitin ligase complex SCF subunit n=1 Tax=Paramicrosporidium saccamoebae TaxID=1246581 RepID=A0A2H9THJ0_9FUNG|nr:S-phase kinase-associated protein 1A [Paramicrosporidium saccamoebae]
MTDSAKITLVTEDGQRVLLERKSAQQIGILKTMMNSPNNIFPVPAVKSTILTKVIEFLDQHADDPVPLPSKQPIASRDGDDDDDEGDDDADVSTLTLDSSVSSDDEYIYEDYLASVTPWDQRFLDVDLPTLIELTKAANYLNVPVLLDLCCRTIARQMTGLKAEELRKKFNLPNDFTPEEEAKMAAEFAWIEE